MKDNTLIKVAGVFSISAITVSTVLIGHIDGAFASTMCAIIGGICGYELRGTTSKA